MEITKVIIPSAGLGTRFFPYTKAIPKEMLPLIHKPALQLIIEECMQSALSHAILITNKEKTAIIDYFNPHHRLHSLAEGLPRTGAMLDELAQLIKKIEISTIDQSKPLGLGHAVWLARTMTQKDYFAVCLPDDIICGSQPGIAQLMEIARQEKASVIAVKEVPSEMLASYGVIGVKKQIHESLFEVSHLVEKPHPKDAPSNLAIVGRYVLSPLIHEALENISGYAHTELHLTDAISQMLNLNERVFAYKIQGTRYDIGTPLGWVKALVGIAWNDPLYGPHIRQEIAALNEDSAHHQTQASESCSPTNKTL